MLLAHVEQLVATLLLVTPAVLHAQAVPTLMFWEVRRKDFWENMAHHIATIGLITYSYQVKCGPTHAQKEPMCQVHIAVMCQDPGQLESHAWPVRTWTGVDYHALNLRFAAVDADMMQCSAHLMIFVVLSSTYPWACKRLHAMLQLHEDRGNTAPASRHQGC